MAELAEAARERRQAIRNAKPSTEMSLAQDIAGSIRETMSGMSVEDFGPQFNPLNLGIDSLELVGLKRRIGWARKRGKKVPRYDQMKQRIEGVTLDAVVEFTMEGASTITLTLNDPMWVLLDSGIFDTDENERLDPIDIALSGLWFRLVKVSPNGGTLTLVFEDREVALMREVDKPRSLARDDSTRGQAVASFIRDVKATRVKYFIPELNERELTGKVKRRPSGGSTSRASRRATVHRKVRLTVQGKAADAEQRHNIAIALDLIDELNVPRKAAYALLIACIHESWFRNLHGGHDSSVGVLQLLNIHGSVARRRNVRLVMKLFLQKGFTGAGGAIALARKHPSWSSALIAHTVQGNSTGTGVYAQWVDEASAMLRYAGELGSVAGKSVSRARVKQYRFKRGSKGEREDTWTCIQRLASEVGARCFMRWGVVYWMSETWLLDHMPVSAVIDRWTEGVDAESFGGDWDTGKLVKEISFDITAGSLWDFNPGSVIEIVKAGTFNGKWLVAKISKSLYATKMTLTLKRATKPKPEPKAETVESGSSGSSGGGGGSSSIEGVPPAVARAYAKAKAIDAKRHPYVWGGGHRRAGTPDGGTGRDRGTGYDCSGAVGACLAAGGIGPYANGRSVPGSGTMAGQGSGGKGKYITIYANSVHVYMSFRIKGKTIFFGTSRENPNGGAGFHSSRTGAGFSARHFGNL